MTKNDNVDKAAVGAGCAIIFLWLIGSLLSLGFTAVVIWAIV